MTTEREYQEWRERRNRKRTPNFSGTTLSSRRNRKRTPNFSGTTLSSQTVWKILGLIALVFSVLVLHHSIKEDSRKQPSPDYPLLEKLRDGKQI